MQVILIRHGMTRGNTEGRYIGRTDEPLCQAGCQSLKEYLAADIYPKASKVVTSPMLRCRETAALLYPEQPPLVVDDFRECDFGAFEGMNYQELSGNPDYQKWIDSNGELPFPGGEKKKDFQVRCVRAFAGVMEHLAEEISSVAFVVHGGTIMSIMEHYAEPKGSYYHFQVKNGLGYLAEYKEGRLQDVYTLEECVRSR